MPPVDPARLRTVHVITEGESFKSLYYDRDTAALRPNLIVVEPDGSRGFEINEVGLKGDPLDAARRLAVLWGDSVAFASGLGWACLIDALAPGWQFLNGGLDGDPYTNILRRAREFNLRHPVKLNLLMLGWHPFVMPEPERGSGWRPRLRPMRREALRPGNRGIRADLTAFLREVPNTVLLTMPTALNPALLDRDLSPLLVRGDDETAFRFLGNVPYAREAQRQGYEHIVERNTIAREVCAALEVRIVDLFAAFDTAPLADFREHFIDLIHFRPRAHPLVARRVHDAIKDLLV